jgi:hypothetical protein
MFVFMNIPADIALGDNIVSAPQDDEYGFDISLVDRGLEKRELYDRWYGSGRYSVTLKLLEGVASASPYNANGPAGQAIDLKIDEELNSEKIITAPAEKAASSEGPMSMGYGFTAEIISLNGKAELRSSKTKEWTTVNVGSALGKESIFKTAKEGFAIIKLTIKGSVYLIEAGENTQFMILEDPKRQAIIIDVGLGDVKVDGTKALKGAKLEIKTPALIVDLKEGSFYASVYGSANRYKKWYTPGVYRIEVQVFEGRVVMAEYTDEGPDYDNAVEVTAGKQAEVEGEVK